MNKNKKSSFWSWIGNLIFGEKPKKNPILFTPSPLELEYCKNDAQITEEFYKASLVSTKSIPEEEISELDYLKQKFEVDMEKRDQRLKRITLREQRWLDWKQRQAARDEIRFRRSVLRDAQKQLRQTLRDDRDIEREAENMLQWLAAHSRASRVAIGAIEMAGGVMTALRMRPEVVAWIQENLGMDIADVYFKAIDDMIDATKRFEKAEDALIQAFDQIEKDKEEPLESVIPKGLEI